MHKRQMIEKTKKKKRKKERERGRQRDSQTDRREIQREIQKDKVFEKLSLETLHAEHTSVCLIFDRFVQYTIDLKSAHNTESISTLFMVCIYQILDGN